MLDADQGDLRQTQIKVQQSARNLREICGRFRVKQDQPTNRVTYRAMCTQLEVTIEEKGVNINKVVNTRASTMWKWAWAAMRYRWVSGSNAV